MRLPDTLTAEGRAAIIACLRIAAQMGEESELPEKDPLVESKRKRGGNAQRRNRKDFLIAFDVVVTQSRHKRRKRLGVSR
jgi:hypothetical protein